MKKVLKIFALAGAVVSLGACQLTKDQDVQDKPGHGDNVLELPKDSEPDNYDFTRKILLIQFTGTGCGYCPFMVNALNDLATTHGDKFVWTSCHAYNSNDPAYLGGLLPNAMGVDGFPYVALDLNPSTGFSNYSTTSATLANAKREFDKEYDAEYAKAGIAVANVLKDNVLTVRTGIKVAEDGEYRVGVWVLEDDIHATQANYGATGTFNVHNNCIRLISGQTGRDFSGIPVYLEAGDVFEDEVSFELPSKVKGENCHVVVFVSTERNEKFYVNNAVDCPLNDSVGYSYSE